jgi:MFS superfamily sulfate permease-like transporter
MSSTLAAPPGSSGPLPGPIVAEGPPSNPAAPDLDESFARNWRSDLPAGLVVFLVAVPLCLGIALASGAPLFSGLVSGLVGGLVVSLLSGSQLMVSGPAAGLTAIVISAIAQLGSFEAFLPAVVLAGVLQLVLAALRAGIIGYFFPSSVIKGMLAAIGLILILKQLPHAVGYDVNAMGDETFRQPDARNTFTSLAAAARAFTLGPTALSLASLVLLVLWDRPGLKRRFRWLPGPLVVVVLGVLANELFAAVAPALVIGTEHRVQLPQASSIGEWLALFIRPDWSGVTRPETWTVAVTIALVASLETLLSLEATDKIDPYKREAPANRELFAQGIGNTLCGLIGGLPITGVIVRSSVNIDSGARTRWSAFFHGLLLLVALLAFPGLLNRIPLASLAANLLYTGYKLAHPRLFRTAYRVGWNHFLPFLVTVIAIVLTDLLIGIALGLGVGAFFVLKNNYDHAFHQSTENYHYAKVIRLTLSEDTSFLNKASIVTTLNELPPGVEVEVDGSRARYIDYDVLEILNDFRETARLRHIKLRLIDIPEVATTPHH